LGDLGKDLRIKPRWILRKYSGNLWTGLNCPRIATSDKFL